MSDAQALEEIKRLVGRGCVRFSSHAIDRMDERGAVPADVCRALATATSATAQDNGKHRVAGGVDRDGDDMTVIVAVEADVVIVTIF